MFEAKPLVRPDSSSLSRSEWLAGQALSPLLLQAAVLQAEAEAKIIAQGEQVEYCYEIVTGCVRTARLMSDGRRQVGEFLLPGDIFGWEALGEHEFGVDAVTPVTLRRVPSSVIEQRADNDPAFAQQLRQYSAAQVRATRRRLVLLGRKTAAERVASFLLEMGDRLPASENSVLRLPMSRGDVADYLGLTVETVCRGLAELRQRGIIVVERARIAILDRRALHLAAADRLY